MPNEIKTGVDQVGSTKIELEKNGFFLKKMVFAKKKDFQ